MNKQTQKSKNEDLSTTIIINENRSIYYLNLKSSGNMITFSLNYDSNIYEKEAYLWEIKSRNRILCSIHFPIKNSLNY